MENNSVRFAVSSLDDKNTQYVHNYAEFFKYVSRGFSKSEWNVLVLISTDCNLSCRVSTNLNITLTGCKLFQFKLIFRKFLKLNGRSLMQVQCSVIKLRTSLNFAKLYWVTLVSSELREKPQYSFTCHMLNHYVDLRRYIINLSEDKIDDLPLGTVKECRVDRLLNKHSNLDGAAKRLHKSVATVRAATAYFGTVMEDYHEF